MIPIGQLLEPPPDVPLATYRSEFCSFDYPVGGDCAEFEREGGAKVTKLHVDVGEGAVLSISITRQAAGTPVQAAAEAAYRDADRRFDGPGFNMEPARLPLTPVEGWRCRKRFVDGAAAPLVLDMAFLGTSAGLYALRCSVPPRQYEAWRWVFDHVIATFAAPESA